jgi:hypothetical protein
VAANSTNSANSDVVGCVGLVVVGLILWLAYDNLPISAYAVAAGLATLFLWWAEKALAKDDRRPVSFPRRLRNGLVTDGKRVAFWLFIGFSLVLLIQVAVNLFRSHVDPYQVLSAELALYEFSEWMTRLASATVALVCFGIALLLSILMSTLWPIAALGTLRKVLSAGIVAFAAMTGFSLVAIGEAAGRYDFATGPIRAAIVEDLEALAQARRDGAAFQWLAAEFNQARPQAQPAIRAWEAYFGAAAAGCERDNLEFRRNYRVQLRQALARAPASEQDAVFVRAIGTARDVPTYCRTDEIVKQLAEMRASSLSESAAVRIRPWLPDYVAHLGPPPPAGEGAGGEFLDNPVIESRGRRLADLEALRSSIGAALRREEAARDAARAVAVDAIAELLPGSARGAAGAIVDAWKGVLVEVLASETAARIGQRIAWLRRGGALPAESADRLAATHFPLDTPLAGRTEERSIEAAVGADLSHLDRPAPAAAAMEAASERVRPSSPRIGGAGVGPHGEPIHPVPVRPIEVPYHPPVPRFIPRR